MKPEREKWGAPDKGTHLFRPGFIYNSFDQAAAFTETSFEGDDIFVNGFPSPDSQTLHWDSLSTEQKHGLVNGLIEQTAEVREIVTINRYDGVKYNPSNQMSDYDLTTYRRGTAFQDFAELATLQQSLAQVSGMVELQTQQVESAQAGQAAAFQAWREAYDQAAPEFGGLPDAADPQAVMEAVSARLEARYSDEAVKENLSGAAKEDLDAKVLRLSQLASQVTESQRLLGEMREEWESAVDSMEIG